MSIDTRLDELVLEAEARRRTSGWSTVFPTVSELLKEDASINGTIPLERLTRYRDILGAPSLLRELVKSGMVADMPYVYKQYMLSSMLPTSLTILRIEGYNWTVNELNEYLTYERWILNCKQSYSSMLQEVYKDNSIMYRKWARYAENIRGLI
jgi:hypothetical protein